MAGSIKGITIEFRGETTQLQKALRGVDSELSKTQKSLSQVNKAIKFNPNNVELLKQKQSLLRKEIEGTTEKLDILKKAQSEMDAKGVDKNSQEYMDLRRQIIETESRLKNFKGQLDAIGNADLTALAGKIGAVGKKAEEAGQSLSKNVTAPIMALGGAAIASFTQVDEGYDTIIAKTGATGEALEAMKESFNNIAKSVPASMEEIGTAIGEVNTRFGITGDELESLSAQFIKFAQLNGQDAKSAIDETQKALAAFGLSAESASGFLDVMNVVAQNTGVSTSSLQSGLVSNAAAFQELGLSLEQSTILMGSLEKSGANSETVLNGMRKALKNATEEGIPLNEALANLEDTIVNGTDGVDGLTAAYDLFGKSGDQIYSAVKTGTLSFQDLADASVDAGNSVSDTFEATLDPVDKFKLALQNLQIVGAEVGAKLLDVFTPAIEKLGEIIEKAGTWWEGLSPDMQDMIIKFALVAAAVGPVLIVFGKLAGAVKSIMTLVSTLGPVIGGALAAAAPVVAAIAAIVAIGVILYKNWDTIKAKAIELWAKLKKAFYDGVDLIKKKVQAGFQIIKDKIITPIQNAKDSVVNAFNTLKTNVSNIVTSIKTKISTIFGNIKSSITNTVDNIKTKVGNAFNTIKDKMITPIQTAYSTVKGWIDKIKGFFPFNLGKILNLKIPHISISGGEAPWGIMGKGKLPSFNVEWYKTGGIFNKPNIIGVGEAGSEAVVPLDKFWNKLDRLNGGNTINMNITVNGTDSPEEWAHSLVKQMKLEMRSM